MATERAGKSAGPVNRIEQRLSTLPTDPGVYLMRDASGRIIYVGKAKHLANRVRSYFRGTPADPKTAALVRRISDLDYIVTDSEVEALILEINLIKEHRPRYNVLLKDDKRYPYLRVTLQEPFPRVEVTRRYVRDGSKYYGPYTNAGAMRTTLEALNKIFPLRHCHYPLPEKRGRRECLNYFLGNCSGPCHGHISQEDYRGMISEVVDFLGGRTEAIEERLRRQMEQASELLDFELAARCRDRLAAIRKVAVRQKMHNVGGDDQDVLAVSVDGGDACGVILKIRSGKLLAGEHRYLHSAVGESPAVMMRAFIEQNYLGDRDYPPEVLLSQEVEDREVLEQLLGERQGRKVQLRVPERGDKAGLVAMAERNSHLLLEELVMLKDKSRQRVPAALLTLQKTLTLPHLPRVMVCFDVSTLQGRYAVAAMSFFRNGVPVKSGYRKFRIRRVEGQDDFAMMGEAVERYFRKVGSGDFERPQLVVIDGGKGQLRAAQEAIGRAGVEPPSLVALAKREEELFLPGRREPFLLSRRNEALRMLQRLRDEAHRFAVSYHRQVAKQETLRSRLLEIPGVGPARAAALIGAFGSVVAVAGAGSERLAAVEGISPELADRIAAFLNQHLGEPDAQDA